MSQAKKLDEFYSQHRRRCVKYIEKGGTTSAMLALGSMLGIAQARAVLVLGPDCRLDEMQQDVEGLLKKIEQTRKEQ